MNDLNHLLDDLDWIRKSKKLLDALNIGYLLQDMNDNIIEANESLLKLMGKTHDELVGHHASEFFSEEEYRALREGDLLKMDKEYYKGEYFLYGSSGLKIPVLFCVSINKDSFGRPISENVLILDIREQKQTQARLRIANQELININQILSENQESLKNEKRKLEAILFGIGDSVSVFDLSGTHLLSNVQAQKIYKEQQHAFLPLKPCRDEIIILNEGNKQRHFEGRIEEVRDTQGQTYAYVEILKDISNQIELKSREQELLSIKRQINLKKVASEIITASPRMHKCINTALLCAERDSTVLIMGETGVGKNMIAEAIHTNSHRRNMPFVPVNCGALPENLVESELFGHTRGSFSGAIADSVGLFRAADGGTLFLDEVGDLGLSLQVKLLRAIQEKEIRPVGSSKAYPVNVRLLCATNKDLAHLVEQGLFRQDLYYRIAVIPLIVPPLRERKEDILVLANHFINEHAGKNKRQKLKLHHDTQNLLIEYRWPGNVRELQNVLEYVMAMTAGPLILPEHLPVYLSLPIQANCELSSGPKSVTTFQSTKNDIPERLAESEKEAILNALWRCKFNQTRAAKELGISRITLWRKMSKYNDI